MVLFPCYMTLSLYQSITARLHTASFQGCRLRDKYCSEISLLFFHRFFHIHPAEHTGLKRFKRLPMLKSGAPINLLEELNRSGTISEGKCTVNISGHDLSQMLLDPLSSSSRVFKGDCPSFDMPSKRQHLRQCNTSSVLHWSIA